MPVKMMGVALRASTEAFADLGHQAIAKAHVKHCINILRRVDNARAL
jgi:hypothetical protein